MVRCDVGGAEADACQHAPHAKLDAGAERARGAMEAVEAYEIRVARVWPREGVG